MTSAAQSAFHDVPRTAKQHFTLHLLAVAYHIIDRARRFQPQNKDQNELEAMFDTYPFLTGYFADMLNYMPDGLTWDEGHHWWVEQIALWEQDAQIHLPLRALTQSPNSRFDFYSRLVLILVGLVEEDSRFSSLFAALQAPLAHRRPCVDIVAFLLQPYLQPDKSDPWQLCQPLLEAELLQADNQDAPRAEWVLRVPTHLWDVIRGDGLGQPRSGIRYYAPAEFPSLADLILPEDFQQQLLQVKSLLDTGQPHTLVLRGAPGSDRERIMGALAATLGYGLILLPYRPEQPGEGQSGWAVGAFCLLTRTMPVLVCDLGPGETAPGPDWPGYSGPSGVLLGFEGGLDERSVASAMTITVPFKSYELRRREWERAWAGTAVEGLETISERYHLPGAYIRQLAQMARVQARLDATDVVGLAQVQAAYHTLNRHHLDSLATYLPVSGSWDEVVVGDFTRQKLNELARRCYHRERLLDHLGSAFAHLNNRGVRALFTGSSGTGKTLAARVLAAELGMDLYRVDLAAVVNKYIGETEKNLHRVLSRAEALDVILLLDEGDALLGNRTEVRSANDRYANLETDYLLQRLEHYQGIVIITTNAGENIDRAFQRRMDIVVSFVPPEAEERWQIWQLHLPPVHHVPEDYLQQVAIQCQLNGGQIRNAALLATLLALDEGQDQPLLARHLEQALQSEYRKAGATFPLHRNGMPLELEGMTTFLDAFMRS